MPIYPSSGYNDQIPSSVLVVNNITEHREIDYFSNQDGTGKLTPTPQAVDLYFALTDLYDELQTFYFGGLNIMGGDSANTGKAPSVSNIEIDVFTNVKQIKLRRLQTRCKLLGFELKRLTAEMNQIRATNSEAIPENTTFNYPSSQRSPDPDSGW